MEEKANERIIPSIAAICSAIVTDPSRVCQVELNKFSMVKPLFFF